MKKFFNKNANRASMGQGPDKAALMKNRAIEQKNRKDFDKENRVIKLLLLGTGESGKSTIFKQISIINGEPPSQQELEEVVPVIHMNIFNNILLILEYVAQEGYDMGDLRQDVDDFKAKYSKNSKLTKEAVEYSKAFFHSEWGQKAWSMRADYQVLDALEYFMKRIDDLADEDYTPTLDDFLHSRIRSTGIVTRDYKIKGANFKILDVGGQRNERKKWMHCFDNVTSIIFVAAINEYDQKLWEDLRTHRITEALNLFRDQLDNALFKNIPIILFLNKVDLFHEKLRKAPLQVTYPDFQGPYIGDEGVPDDEAEHAAREYMKRKFLDIAEDAQRKVYVYFTTATDEENVEKVFLSIRDIVLQQTMQKAFG